MEKTEIDRIFSGLQQFGLMDLGHSGESLAGHLKGTHNILERWGCLKPLCIGGLCHSIYGTESYSAQAVPLESRTFVKKLIGEDAESLAYFFGAHEKTHFWGLLDKNSDFEIKDRFNGEIHEVDFDQISAMVTLTLANWLEQRPRAGQKNQFIRKEEFLASKRFLPKIAYEEFLKAYEIKGD